MSFGWSAATWAAIGAASAAAGVAVQYQNGQNQMKAANEANNIAKKNAMRQEQMADEANNAANKKTANVSGILSAAQQSGKGGVSSTMLTGAGGVDPMQLQLGRNTLLGS